MNRINKTSGAVLIAALLGVVTLAAFWPVLHSGFIRLDDGGYVVRNPHVRTGLTWDNLRWAWGARWESNWHPLTWVSHIMDVQLFGLRPGWHHLTSLLFHVANAILLFFWLERLTGARWRCATVAALFAWHPLHVESVAWVAERKDVLSTFFFLLTLMAYSRYVEARSRSADILVRPFPCSAGGGTGVSALRAAAASARGGPWAFYMLALLLFALGLLSKPMVVTLPFVLLLLDYWPLGRLKCGAPAPPQEPSAGGPSLGALGAAGDAAGHGEGAAPGCGRPVFRLVWEKAPFFGLAAISSIITFVVQKGTPGEALVLPLAARLANAIASYLKYLAKMVWPADLAVFYPHPALRYPHSHQWPAGALVAAALLLAAISLLAVLWRKRRPWLAVGWLWYLGTLVPVIGIVQVGRQGMADRYSYIPLIGIFICLVWGTVEAWGVGRGKPALAAQPSGNEPRGRAPFRAGLAVAGTLALAACLVVTRVQAGYWQTNLALFEHALEVTMDNAVAHFHVGTGLGEQGQFELAKGHFQAAIQADPSFAPPYYSLGLILAAQGKPAEAIVNYRQALKLTPNWATALDQLAWILATHPQAEIRNGPEAVRLAERACELTGGQSAKCWGTLDAAYAEAGRFAEAVRTAGKARALAQAAGQKELAQAAETRLALYRREQPYREAP